VINKNPMIILKHLDNWIAKIENILLIFFLSIMILLAFFQIPLTRIYPIQGIETLLRHLVLLAGFLGATLATRENRHINIDVLSRILKDRWKILGEIFTHLFAAVICTFLTIAAIDVIKDSKSVGETASIITDIPTWTIQLIFVFGFGLMIFRFSLKVLEKIIAFARGLKGGEK